MSWRIEIHILDQNLFLLDIVLDTSALHFYIRSSISANLKETHFRIVLTKKWQYTDKEEQVLITLHVFEKVSSNVHVCIYKNIHDKCMILVL